MSLMRRPWQAVGCSGLSLLGPKQQQLMVVQQQQQQQQQQQRRQLGQVRGRSSMASSSGMRWVALWREVTSGGHQGRGSDERSAAAGAAAAAAAAAAPVAAGTDVWPTALCGLQAAVASTARLDGNIMPAGGGKWVERGGRGGGGGGGGRGGWVMEGSNGVQAAERSRVWRERWSLQRGEQAGGEGWRRGGVRRLQIAAVGEMRGGGRNGGSGDGGASSAGHGGRVGGFDRLKVQNGDRVEENERQGTDGGREELQENGSEQGEEEKEDERQQSSVEEVEMAAAFGHVAATWGNADFGRLGLGPRKSSQLVPALCPLPGEEDLVQVACGGAHTLFLSATGKVFSAGLNDFGQLGAGPAGTAFSLTPQLVPGLPPIQSVAAGDFHSAAIDEKGSCWVWGSNRFGQLGLGSDHGISAPSPSPLSPLAGVKLKQLALGAQHSLAVSADGVVFSWGNASSGRLGHGRPSLFRQWTGKQQEFLPRLLRTLPDVEIIQVAAGSLHSLLLDAYGRVWACGGNRFCQLGIGHERDVEQPEQIKGLPAVSWLAAGGYHSAAVTVSAEVFSWGSNEHGCLGLGRQEGEQPSSEPKRVEGQIKREPIVKVECGWKHTLALAENGHLYSWGWGGSDGTFANDRGSSGGQLGLGNENVYMEPEKIFLAGVRSNKVFDLRFSDISCGFNHSAGVVDLASSPLLSE